MKNELALALVKAREASGYSQRDVAQLLGVAPSVINRVETGERAPSLQLAVSLGFLFDLPIDQLCADMLEGIRANLAAQLPFFLADSDPSTVRGIRGESLCSLQARLDEITAPADACV